MSPALTGMGEPPEELQGFPEAPDIIELHRLSEYPATWWYASVEHPDDTAGGRFDLPHPRGTCYLAETLEGAVIEKLLRAPAKVVVAERLDEMFHTTVAVRASPRIADLTNRRATGFGLNAEIHATLHYGRSRRWAVALHSAGFRGLRHLLRGDVSRRHGGRALFGSAGLRHRAPAGMTSSVQPLDRSRVEGLLSALGVVVRPMPTTVPILPPPA